MRAAIGAAALACAGCQFILGIDPDVPILDGGANVTVRDGGAPCTSSTSLLCDDFEQGTIDTQRWEQVEQQNATVKVDTTRPHWGSWSLHATANAVTLAGAPNTNGFVDHENALPAHFFVRFFLFVPMPSVVPPKAQIVINAVNDPGLGMQLALSDGNLAFTDWASTSEVDLRSSTASPTNTWQCIEWEVIEGQPQGQMNVWVDGSAMSDLDVAVPTVAYSVLKLGIGFFQPQVQPLYEVWIDDVRVEASRVGCSE